MQVPIQAQVRVLMGRQSSKATSALTASLQHLPAPRAPVRASAAANQLPPLDATRSLSVTQQVAVRVSSAPPSVEASTASSNTTFTATVAAAAVAGAVALLLVFAVARRRRQRKHRRSDTVPPDDDSSAAKGEASHSTVDVPDQGEGATPEGEDTVAGTGDTRHGLGGTSLARVSEIYAHLDGTAGTGGGRSVSDTSGLRDAPSTSRTGALPAYRLAMSSRSTRPAPAVPKTVTEEGSPAQPPASRRTHWDPRRLAHRLSIE